MTKTSSARKHTLPTTSFGYERASEYIHYDPADGFLYWKKSPSSRVKAGDKAGHVFTDRIGKKYRVVKLKGIKMYAHNVIFLLVTGSLPVNQVDHIDGDGLNNIWENLRDVTVKENRKNLKKSCKNTSGITGVCWDSNKKSWKPSIQVDRKMINLPRTKDFFEACCRRKSAERKYGFHDNHGTDRSL